jgi:hypothetical protein
MNIEKVTLESSTNGKREFAFEHAKRLLASEAKLKANKKTWTLPTDSPYTFNNGDLIKRGGAPLDKGAQESKGDTESQGQEDKA